MRDEKLAIVRFTPKPAYLDRFIQEHSKARAASDRTVTLTLKRFFIAKDDKLFSIVLRYAGKLEEDAKRGVQTLDGMRHMLQEYNEIDRHMIPLTGDWWNKGMIAPAKTTGRGFCGNHAWVDEDTVVGLGLSASNYRIAFMTRVVFAKMPLRSR